MSKFVPRAGASLYKAVGAAPANITGLEGGAWYLLTVTTPTFFKQGPATSTPIASAADGTGIINPEHPLWIHGDQGDTLSVLRVSADGHATLQRMDRLIG